jgi:sporulation protein YlmC with PRC-barrel domain
MAVKNKTYEADNLTGLNHEGVDANTPVHRLTATSIIGDKLENPSGENLGKIVELMINTGTGEIEYVVIEFGSVFGIGGKLFAIPFEELRLKPSEHTFILNRDKAYLKKSPGFDKNHWPETNDLYYEDVNVYYKISSDSFIP